MTQMKRISQETFDAQIIVGFPCEGQPHCFFQLFGGMMTHHAPHCIRTRGFHLRGSQVILHRYKETVRKGYTESLNHDPPSPVPQRRRGRGSREPVPW